MAEPCASLTRAAKLALEDSGIAPGQPVALAVSGGADSLALMLALKDRPGVTVLTVDHGLRAEAAGECAFVARAAETLSLPCHIFTVDGQDHATNLQESARLARYMAMEDWCAAGQVRALLTAHHQDDQAETFFLRLARGSDVKGLAAIPPSRPGLFHGHVTCIRPFLDVPKAVLASAVADAGLVPVIDPSNQDPRFDRVKLRQWLAAAPLPGLGGAGIARTATQLSEADTALDYAADTIGLAAASLTRYGTVTVPAADFSALPHALSVRVLLRVMAYLADRVDVHPRGRELVPLVTALRTEDCRRTLGGCLFDRQAGLITIGREAASLQPQTVMAGGLYGGCWQVHQSGIVQPYAQWVEATGLETVGTKTDGEKAGPLPGSALGYVQSVPHVWRQALPVLVTLDGCVHIAGLHSDDFSHITPPWVKN